MKTAKPRSFAEDCLIKDWMGNQIKANPKILEKDLALAAMKEFDIPEDNKSTIPKWLYFMAREEIDWQIYGPGSIDKS